MTYWNVPANKATERWVLFLFNMIFGECDMGTKSSDWVFVKQLIQLSRTQPWRLSISGNVSPEDVLIQFGFNALTLRSPTKMKYSSEKEIVLSHLIMTGDEVLTQHLRQQKKHNIVKLFFSTIMKFQLNICITTTATVEHIEYRRDNLYRRRINSERSDECIDFTMIITSRNNASISNFGGSFRWKNEYLWCNIEVREYKYFSMNDIFRVARCKEIRVGD
ncbi:hypothetical protein AGLY_006905 [Aphis glycines]|uniref:Uncharacterized protein n=1 Tax=Aphis glycines TaxID=307491 RepID=A0A6G0TSA3_APHGL|nr:hypothetical protein AGLY_006905 [Aphis glycines]